MGGIRPNQLMPDRELARQDFERAIELGVDRGSLSEEFKALK